MDASNATELVEQTNFSLPCNGNKLRYVKDQFICGTCSMKERNSICVISLNDKLSYEFEQIEVDSPILDVSKLNDYFIYTNYDLFKNIFNLKLNDFKETCYQIDDVVCFDNDLLGKRNQIGMLDVENFKFSSICKFENVKTVCKREQRCLVANNNNIQLVDPLAPVNGVVFSSHALDVLCIDINPVMNDYFVSGGMDRKVNIWDVRQPKEPVLSLNDHTHWVLNCKYNPFYDQLILTTGSDGAVILYDITTFSSKKIIEEEEVNDNSLIAKWDNLHEPSITGAAWSGKDPWLFGALSETQIAFARIPQQVRYQLLTG